MSAAGARDQGVRGIGRGLGGGGGRRQGRRVRHRRHQDGQEVQGQGLRLTDWDVTTPHARGIMVFIRPEEVLMLPEGL